jgi:RNA polymerase sigma factor (sigma-70 family)
MATAQLGTLLGHIQKLAGGPCARQGTDRQLLEDFSARHDEGAFAALVARHGPMVLRVCRRVLGHEQDAEDAFQATFLVLARNTSAIRKREALPGWLHGVAYRTAMKAKRGAARRRNHEARLRSLTPGGAPGPRWDDVQAALDEEIQRLPEHHRTAFVRCAVEGKTVPEAAAELGVKEGTLSSWLMRARRRLQRQLARRGIKLAALLAALSLAEGAGKAAVPAALVRSTVRFGLLVAAGEPAAGVISPHVAALAAGVTRAMFLKKVKIAFVLLLAAGLVAAGAGVLARPAQPAAEQPEVRSQEAGGRSPKSPAAAAKGDRAEVSGRVLGPDRRPVAGAKLFLLDEAGKSAAPQPAADAEGRFRFPIPDKAARDPRFLVATADGLGLDWASLRAGESGHDLTLRLPADLPIRGKVVDLEGKPVAGATVRIVELTTAPSDSLDEFLKQWAADKEKAVTGPTFRLLTGKALWPSEALRHLGSATTGPDGAFRLTGIGRDRGLMLGVRGPGIADHYARVVTRPDFPASPPGKGQVALQGPEPAVAVAQAKPIQGTLRDARTKQPLAGVRVLAYTPDRPLDWWWQPVETVTDAQGRYRLDGLAKMPRQIVAFDPGPGAPYMHRFDEVGDTDGFVPTVHDTELYRGVVVSGQVTDKSTGRPVRARVVYAPLYNNKNYGSTPGYDHPRTQLTLWVDSREMTTGADGRFRLTALPGSGALFVQAVAGRFTQPVVAKEDRDPGAYRADADLFVTLGLGDIFPMSHLHAYRLIRPAADATELVADIALDPGVHRRGRLLDPDGHEVSGAEAVNLSPPGRRKTVLPGAEFTAEVLNPAKPRRLLFLHHQRKLAGTVVLRGDEPEPVTVTLRPLAALTGRAVSNTGEPIVGYAVQYSGWPELEWPIQGRDSDRAVVTDKEGRFRLPDLPAGVPLNLAVTNVKTHYSVIHRRNIVLEPGKMRDLGSLRGTPEDGQ